jgi:hypothetical protein
MNSLNDIERLITSEFPNGIKDGISAEDVVGFVKKKFPWEFSDWAASQRKALSELLKIDKKMMYVTEELKNKNNQPMKEMLRNGSAPEALLLCLCIEQEKW